MNNQLDISRATITTEQKIDFEKNFQPNGKDNVLVNPNNSTLYIAALLDYIYTDAIIKYDSQKQSFSIYYKSGKNHNVSIEFKEEALADVFNTFTSQLLKMCNYHGNQWTTELIQHICW